MRHICKWSFILGVVCVIFLGGCGDKNTESGELEETEAQQYVFEDEADASLQLMSNLATMKTAREALHDSYDTNSFAHKDENAFKLVSNAPLSTFGSDVDTASYAIVRKAIESGEFPQKGAVRIEELLNNFTYHYPSPKDSVPLSIDASISDALWNPHHKVLRIGIQAKEIDWTKRKPFNLIFLIDTSGSMEGADRLGLVKKSLKMLVENLNPNDSIGIVTYAGASSVSLQPTTDKLKALHAIESLVAIGSTNGGSGIKDAYALAKEHFIKGGVNRVILATDGDFNVGITSESELVELIKQQAQSGVYLSVFGYGMGNYKDSTLQKLADSGNGNYAYIDTLLEAKKHLVEQVGATLVAVAKDVKIQVEFNPVKVSSYRLIGYEKRLLNDEDFNNDDKDAGEMGAGHSVTALYELIPTETQNADSQNPTLGKDAKGMIDPLKYSQNIANKGFESEWVSVKVRYKEPSNLANAQEKSMLLEKVVRESDVSKDGSADMRFAQCVAEFGMLLLDSEHKGNASYESILKVLEEKGVSDDVYRKEFIGLVAKASRLSPKPSH
ncbi:VWA domain-containing protein [Helicobacter sp. MIT 05-5293]|uniref:vWA domain-containing protein n=1 Tax=Helicobacter sp. MIT 05-5293 TaxID=1548149 RepID=UPI00051F8C2E|nr:VWA domain-containing protein [Helicobacter sp. MIT 05-5293]TLD80817.1 VWA domain-containing protein [Helicobacter sp. MIT 05-5293]